MPASSKAGTFLRIVNMILEKSCKCYIDAMAIGGADSLPEEEAIEMHRMYMEEYSVTDQEEKQKAAGIL